MKKFCMLLLVVMVLGVCGGAFADRHPDHEEQYVRAEAERRSIKLLTIAEVQDIVRQQIGSSNVRFKEIELENKPRRRSEGADFRTVYEIECLSGRDEYDVKIDAVTGQVLKFEIDD